MYELYLFEDNGYNYAYTDSLIPRTLNGITYQPTIIKRSNLKLSSNYSKSELTLNVSKNNSYLKNLLINFSERAVILSIFRNDILEWKGRVHTITLDQNKLTVKCNNTMAFTVRTANIDRATPQCRHLIYAPGCELSKANFLEETVATFSDYIVTTAPLSHGSGYYNNGFAEINNQVRGIISHVNTTLTLVAPFVNTTSGTLKLYPGCKLTEADCAAKGNLINFGGFSRMPLSNPFSGTGAL